MADANTIVVVDDHPLYRSGVIRTLAEDGRFSVVGEGASADDAVALAEKHRPALALLDISMPGNGLEAVRRIRQACPGTRIIMLTVSEADDDIMEALDAGASAYVLKGVGGARTAGDRQPGGGRRILCFAGARRPAACRHEITRPVGLRASKRRRR